MIAHSVAVQRKTGSVGAYYAGQDLDALREIRAAAGHVTVQGRSGLKLLSQLERLDDVWGVDLDPATYLRRRDDDGLFPTPWEDRQRELRLPLVRSAGEFIGNNDHYALDHAARTPLPEDVTRTLSLDASWLRYDRIRAVVTALEQAGPRVALVLASPFDPLAGKDAFTSMQAVLAELSDKGVSVELLRCDTAGVALAAAGGRHAAIGVTASTRHHSLGMKRADAAEYEERQRYPLLFIPELMSWQRANRIGALAPWKGAGLTDCSCNACAGQSLLRFDVEYASTVPAAVQQDARRHDVDTWRALADSVLGAADPLGAWQAQAAAARATALQLASMYRVAFELPRSLHH